MQVLSKCSRRYIKRANETPSKVKEHFSEQRAAPSALREDRCVLEDDGEERDSADGEKNRRRFLRRAKRGCA